MSLEELQAQLRGALDQQFAALKTHYESAIAEARQQTRADAEHELQAKLVTARAEWEEQLNAQVAAVRAEAEQAAATATANLRAELDRERDQALGSAKQAADLELEGERQRSARDLESARQSAALDLEAERQRSARDLESARQAAGLELDSERRRAARDVQAEREVAESIMEQARAAVDSERERARTELEAVRTQLQSDVANAQEAAAREAAAAAAAKASMAAAQAAAHASAAASGSSAASVAMYTRVATGIRTLDSTNTLGDSLDALVACAGAIAGRAALFLVDGDRLKPWKAVTIPDIDVRTVESSIRGRDLLARAIQAGQPIASGPAVPAPAFARLRADRPSLAVPLMIAGRAVAALYVDCGEGAAPSSDWNGAIDLLVRHTSALLAVRTAMRTFDMLRGAPEQAGANGDAGDAGDGGEEAARRFARLLVSEIKLYNEGAVRVGRQRRDLRRRLQDEIERARRLYEERVPAGVSARDAYFQQELVQTLADGDASLLGN